MARRVSIDIHDRQQAIALLGWAGDWIGRTGRGGTQ